ncbi:MAG: transcriptional regulator [Methanobacteriota archaeon]|nr:MAG: transcriptional regulator [Euryarchaeota archaeon]
MGRRQLIDEVRDVLAKTGFYLSEKHDRRGLSFDVVARRDDLLLMLKILQNVDAFGKANAEELRLIATTLGGSPIVVGERSGSGALEEGVIYSRFGVPIVSTDTFTDLFEEGVPPFMFSAPGGLYVRLDSEALRTARESRGVSLGTLAEVAGVSRRTIQMYLEGMSATVDIALRLEEFLGESLVVPVDPFAYSKETGDTLRGFEAFERFEQDVFRKLQTLGYNVLPTVRCPFEAFATRESLFLTGVPDRGERVEDKAHVMSNISSVVEKDAVLFVEIHTSAQSIGGTPLIKKSELRRIRDRDEIEDLIAERRK